MIEPNQIINGDCLEVMKEIESKSIDMILCDLPYGTTACKWDVTIPFEPLWEQYKRIIKDNGAIVLTASQPFTTDLINSNRKWFKYEWIWDKGSCSSPNHSKIMPMKYHENILVFGKEKINFYPILDKRKNNKDYTNCKGGNGSKTFTSKTFYYNPILRTHTNPKSILKFSSQEGETNNVNRLHPTQKPVALFEYLIRTYTNENETVLDNCSGSGTTAIACIKTDRNYICIEKDKDYFEASLKRIEKENIKLKLAI